MQTPGLGPKVFFTTPLSLFQWFVCILAGLGSLVCYQLVLFIPICAKEKTATKGERQEKMPNEGNEHSDQVNRQLKLQELAD